MLVPASMAFSNVRARECFVEMGALDQFLDGRGGTGVTGGFVNAHPNIMASDQLMLYQCGPYPDAGLGLGLEQGPCFDHSLSITDFEHSVVANSTMVNPGLTGDLEDFGVSQVAQTTTWGASVSGKTGNGEDPPYPGLLNASIGSLASVRMASIIRTGDGSTSRLGAAGASGCLRVTTAVSSLFILSLEV
jgi:hypothetical protein